MTTWTRDDHLDRLRSHGPFDVTVIGGGVIGAGSALDLAARGLKVALIERSDFAQGTSSRSTKLFHGGIRYLPQMQFGLISEGLREQKVLARIADFLYQPLEFLIPLYRQYGLADAPGWAARGWKAPVALRAGLTLYDLLGGFGRPGSRHHRIDLDALTTMMPLLEREGLKGGFSYSDAQTDDARLVVTLAKTAVSGFDTIAVTKLAVERIERIDDGFIIEALDRLGGDRVRIEARAVLAATGAFTPPEMQGDQPLHLLRSKGTHLLAPKTTLDLGDRALVLPETDDGRVMYLVPWLGHTMIGTTDTEYDDDPEHPRPIASEVDYLVRHVKRFLDVPDFEPISAFAGLRALKDEGRGSTATTSREHVIDEPVPGYVRVAGGKLTTYRKIAAEAADRVAARLGVGARSATASIPLVGTAGSHTHMRDRLAGVGMAQSVIGPTIARYGTEIELIARIVEERPHLAEPLGDGRSSLADAVYAVRHEGAAAIGDVTIRRTHLAWFTTDHARSDAARIAAVIGSELGWSEAVTTERMADHERELIAEGL